MTAGKRISHEYLKIKGSFIYRQRLQPEYYWYNGVADRYLLGDPVDDSGTTALNRPKGDIRDPGAQDLAVQGTSRQAAV